MIQARGKAMMRVLKLGFFVPMLAITSCGAAGGDWVFTLQGQASELVQSASVSVCGSSYPLRRSGGQWSVRVPARCEGSAFMHIVRINRSTSMCNAGYVTNGFRQTNYVISVSAQDCRLLDAEAT